MEKFAHHVLRDSFDVRQLFPDYREPIGMYRECQPVKMVVKVAVRLVEAHLLELFAHHLALHFKSLVGKCERLHAVAFKPERSLDIMCRHYVVEVGEVTVGPGIVCASGRFKRFVELRYVFRPSEHQMLKQVRHSGMVRLLVAASHII